MTHSKRNPSATTNVGDLFGVGRAFNLISAMNIRRIIRCRLQINVFVYQLLQL